ncbi:Carboxylesterase NlhH [Paenibacillus nuruki]|uniref:Carboxylesterase NlhH n=1 Tax=Paenibacillus nuruki TaxID=1886670 RepID=A0A1E3L6L3_9BACL|nr:alpha/beta hydrolase [Paenibacillus nuruki]ODP28805.1 Carboxylesterase NlhH [Paenibacillus nuruki]
MHKVEHLDHLEKGIRTLVEEFVEAGRPSALHQSIEERRAGYLSTIALAGDKADIYAVHDITIDEITFRIYQSVDQSNLPVLIYYHGGCFVSGDLETHDQQMRQLALESQSLVIAVDYRLAPEHTYPTAHDDALHAVHIIREHLAEWGGDTDRITIAGDSAGGHLALVTCLRLKEQGDWLPQRQILIYPMLDASGTSTTYAQYGNDYIITRDVLISGYEAYFGDLPLDHPEVSPLYAENLTGLPETYMLTAEFDPLLFENETFYRKLLEADVQAHCRRYLGVNHGFFQLAGISIAARQSLHDVATMIYR